MSFNRIVHKVDVGEVEGNSLESCFCGELNSIVQKVDIGGVGGNST